MMSVLCRCGVGVVSVWCAVWCRCGVGVMSV